MKPVVPLRVAQVVLLALLAAGCSGIQPVAVSPGGHAQRQTQLGAAAAGAVHAEPNQAQLDAQWQAILRNPGTPGVDFDPDLLTVTYKPVAQFPAGIPLAQPVQVSRRAASQGNAQLRRLAGFEQLSDAIAARYGLSIVSQTYVLGLPPVAGFRIPVGGNGAAILAALRSDFGASIQYATFSRLYRAAYNPNDPDWISSTLTTGPLWCHRIIGCEQAWDYTRGSASIRIAVCDTGVRITHEDLHAQVLDPAVAFPTSNLDVANNDNNVADANGHGTFISGLIAGEGNNGLGVVGVAHLCQEIPIKIANSGSTSDLNMYNGVALAVDLGARIVNMSWAATGPSPNLQALVDYCNAHNVLFVAAAGNGGTTSPYYPAAYAGAVSVGATNWDDSRAGFSNYGDDVDIAAPGLFITSTAYTGDSDYEANGAGTSFSAPLICACAGLLLSENPALTSQQVIDALRATGDPTTGFSATNPVLRVNVAAALDGIAPPQVLLPRPDRLVYSGAVAITPTLRGKPEKVEALLNGVVLQTLAAAPWDFSVDTSSVSFGMATLELRATKGTDVASAVEQLAVDNTTGVFPFHESCDATAVDMLAVGGKGLAQSLLSQLILLPASDWTIDKVDQQGGDQWGLDTQTRFSGPGSYYCGKPGYSYSPYDLSCLVMKKIDLANVPNPSLVFRAKCNLENGSPAGADRGYVLGSTDGQTWTPLSFKAGAAAFFSGTHSWPRAEVDLTPFANQQVNLAFVLASNGSGMGDSAGPAGFWIDDITVASNYDPSVPSIAGVSVAPYSVYGAVPGKLEIDAALIAPVNVATVRYTLDLAPLGHSDPYDVQLTPGPPFAGALSLPVPAVRNQLARLRVQVYDALGTVVEYDVPVYIFNLRGDTNADGTVDQADLDAYAGKIGLTSALPGYVPFLDSDLDGVVTELDAAAVGYGWGNAVP